MAVMAAARRKKFLTVLAATANVTRAATAAKLSISTLYRLRARNATFAKAWSEALGAAMDALEGALFERATKGVAKPLMYGGRQVGTVRTYPDAVAMFLLRAHRADIFGKGVAADAAESAPLSALNDRDEFERRLDILAAQHSADACN